MIVADASLIANLLLHPQTDKGAHAVLQRDGEWAAPPLWRSEMHSALIKYIRAHMLTLAESESVMERAIRLFSEREPRAGTAQILRVALDLKISAYDAEYVALAQQLEVPLVTLDQKLVRAAPKIALSPIDFLR